MTLFALITLLSGRFESIAMFAISIERDSVGFMISIVAAPVFLIPNSLVVEIKPEAVQRLLDSWKFNH